MLYVRGDPGLLQWHAIQAFQFKFFFGMQFGCTGEL